LGQAAHQQLASSLLALLPKMDCTEATLTDEDIIKLMTTWCRILPSAKAWLKLHESRQFINRHQKLTLEDWQAILHRIATQARPIKFSASLYLDRCAHEVEDRLKQIRKGPVVDPEDES
jgi:hypothetical protein